MHVCKKCSYKCNLVACKSFATISETHSALNLNWLGLEFSKALQQRETYPILFCFY